MSSDEQRARWDLKYQQGLPSLTEPDPFFISAYESFVNQSFPNAGTALDLAGGLGRHALWLAGRNWEVSVVDVSAVAIDNLRQTALERKLKLELLVTDASEYNFQPSRFDLIVLFYHLDRGILPKIVSALKPDGLLICKLSLQWQGNDAVSGTVPLQRNELLSLVPELQVLHHRERPVRDRGVAEFVGRKTS